MKYFIEVQGSIDGKMRPQTLGFEGDSWHEAVEKFIKFVLSTSSLLLASYLWGGENVEMFEQEEYEKRDTMPQADKWWKFWQK